MKTKTLKRAAPLRSRKRKPDDPEQFKRFVEAACKAGVNEVNSEALDRAFDKIVQSKTPPG
jgi:hypothetical protein